MNRRISFTRIVFTVASVLVIWKIASVLTASPESFSSMSGLLDLVMDAWTSGDYISIFAGIAAVIIAVYILYRVFALFENPESRLNTGSEKAVHAGPGSILSGVVTYSRMIKLTHTVFALPFALSGLILAVKVKPVTVEMVIWIVVAMVGGRSAAMGFNRIADADIDAGNPRTAMREIPAGKISRKKALMFTIFSSVLLVFAAAMLSRVCFWLSFPLLVLLFFYSYTKRFTWLAHIYLGFAIGLAPVAVWIAIAGMPGLSVILLALTLMTHIAGFDILYACQDVEFDRERGLFSIPSHFGVKKAFMISALLHVMTVILLSSIYFTEGFGIYYFNFIAVISVLYVIEHRIVKPDDIKNIDIAFFHINSAISVFVFVAILTGMLTGAWRG